MNRFISRCHTFASHLFLDEPVAGGFRVSKLRILAVSAALAFPLASDFSSPSYAQQPDAAQADEAEAPAPEKPKSSGDPLLKDYEAAVEELRAQMVKLREIWVSYQISEKGTEGPLREEFRLAKEEGHKRMDKVRDTALAAFKTDPVKYVDLGRFLSQYLADCFEDDRINDGIRETAVTLAESGFPDDRLQIMAGITNYGTNRFKEAKKWLEIAAQSGELGPTAQMAYEESDPLAEKWDRELEARKKDAEAGDLPQVLVRTNKGNFVLELFEDNAPGTVGNFISLVEDDFYNGLTFHRVLEHFMAQGGCPQGDGMGGPGYSIKGEASREDHRDHFRGSIAMALSNGPDTGGSQFYVCFYPATQLDGKYTVFGRVIEGMEVFSDITRLVVGEEAKGEAKKQPDNIIDMEVIRKRDHEYKPDISSRD